MRRWIQAQETVQGTKIYVFTKRNISDAAIPPFTIISLTVRVLLKVDIGNVIKGHVKKEKVIHYQMYWKNDVKHFFLDKCL